MSETAVVAVEPTPGRYSHEALFYAGLDEFVERTAAFLREGIESEEPILVVVNATKIDALRQELGGDHSAVQFADMAEVGTNPARIIPAWRDFVDACVGPETGGRGIGEPIWAERTPAELVECQRHESLLNLAFADGPPWRLLCPYDVEALEPAVLDEACRSHPTLLAGDTASTGHQCRSLTEIAAPFDVPLPAPVAPWQEIHFDADGLPAVRRFVFLNARGSLDGRVDDLVLAVNELATNSVRYGGGGGLVRMWREGSTVVCEVEDRGAITDPLAGRVLPGPGSEGGRGLWLVNQLCDLVQVRALASGSIVRTHTHPRVASLSATG